MGKKRQIQAKPTTYAGVDFDSRLEARHAVFYDALRIPWAREPYTFTLTNGWAYTPDFEIALPDKSGLLVEVKPVFPEDDYIEILRAVAPLVVVAVGGFWKGAAPDYYDVDGGGLSLTTLLHKRQQTLERAVAAASGYRFDIA